MIFEPLWELKIDDKVYRGKGLLHKTLWASADSFSSFSVTINQTRITALPKEGRIVLNPAVPLVCKPGKLVWFRRMQMIVGEKSTQRVCACYGLGIENGERHGFRLLHNGEVMEGLN
jgi:hypothetical protein